MTNDDDDLTTIQYFRQMHHQCVVLPVVLELHEVHLPMCMEVSIIVSAQ